MRSIMYWWHTYIVRACMRQKRKFGSCVNYQETFVFGLGTYVHRKYIWRHVNFRYSLCYARPSKTFVHCAIGVDTLLAYTSYFLHYIEKRYTFSQRQQSSMLAICLSTPSLCCNTLHHLHKHCSFTVSCTIQSSANIHYSGSNFLCEAWNSAGFHVPTNEDIWFQCSNETNSGITK